MRQFLYYNQDSINSFLAQIEQGLSLRNESGKAQEKSVSKTQENQYNITGDLSAKVLGIGVALQGDVKDSNSNTEVATQMVRSIQEKVLHDYAFDRILEHLDTNGMINNDNPLIGDVVLINETPTFLDFNYFQALFADNGAMKFAYEQTKKQVEEQLIILRQSVPKGQSISEVMKIKIRELENVTKSAELERREMVKTIETICNTLPYNRFIMTDNLLIPLTDKYLRDDPDIIAFKYGGNISVFGYVTNIIDSKEEKKHSNDFAQVYDTVNKIMLSLFNGKEKIFIVHPIALYY
ncbi:MAG: hypothetical protein WCY62_03520 [Clostridia bacterium]|jgi:hypothetical protein